MTTRRIILAFACCLNSASGLGMPQRAELQFAGEPSWDYASGPFGGCDDYVELQSWPYASWSFRARNLPKNDRLGWTGRYEWAGARDQRVQVQWCTTLGRWVVLGLGDVWQSGVQEE
jgi:hypothetical protein